MTRELHLIDDAVVDISTAVGPGLASQDSSPQAQTPQSLPHRARVVFATTMKTWNGIKAWLPSPLLQAVGSSSASHFKIWELHAPC